ncbi:GNAT family N-acetyltransferase [Aquimarina sp. ERC-38]|uniref:GNAT family N-acetyltransferase n=1 Tax=Aquimarina sp. ERC-38 TaxID=2949996 RepID=UPI0022462E5A|nr:GNAT family protein [Aquimarina sp. ERC-38]UZO79867.1 GNAT family N-acetyltransferase [Aquimarina sp. ERC-38]
MMEVKLVSLIEDAIPFLYKLLSNPLVDQYNTLGIHKEIRETEDYFWKLKQQEENNQSITFVIASLDNQKIGLIALDFSQPKFKSATLWYKIHPDYWRKGVATAAVLKITTMGFSQYHLHRIEAGCAVQNIGSQKVLLKTGFIKEGCKKEVLPLLTGWSDAYIYALVSKKA